MKTNVTKKRNHFSASMILESNSETNNEENLKKFNSNFIKEFIEKEKFLSKKRSNVSLRKCKPVLIGFAIASGSKRARKAIVLAFLPLLIYDKVIEDVKSVLLLVSSNTIEINIDEVGFINDYIQEKLECKATITMIVGEDENLDDALSITIILLEDLKA